jgi:hypothetical protein
MVAELFDGAGLEPGLNRVRHGRDVSAPVAGDAGVRRDGDRAREAIVAAVRTGADRAEDEIAGHGAPLCCGPLVPGFGGGGKGKSGGCADWRQQPQGDINRRPAPLIE